MQVGLDLLQLADGLVCAFSPTPAKFCDLVVNGLHGARQLNSSGRGQPFDHFILYGRILVDICATLCQQVLHDVIRLHSHVCHAELIEHATDSADALLLLQCSGLSCAKWRTFSKGLRDFACERPRRHHVTGHYLHAATLSFGNICRKCASGLRPKSRRPCASSTTSHATRNLSSRGQAWACAHSLGSLSSQLASTSPCRTASNLLERLGSQLPANGLNRRRAASGLHGSAKASDTASTSATSGHHLQDLLGFATRLSNAHAIQQVFHRLSWRGVSGTEGRVDGLHHWIAHQRGHATNSGTRSSARDCANSSNWCACHRPQCRTSGNRRYASGDCTESACHSGIRRFYALLNRLPQAVNFLRQPLNGFGVASRSGSVTRCHNFLQGILSHYRPPACGP